MKQPRCVQASKVDMVFHQKFSKRTLAAVMEDRSHLQFNVIAPRLDGEVDGLDPFFDGGRDVEQRKHGTHVNQRLLGLPVHGAKEVEGHG